LKAGGGAIKTMTLAPERRGGGNLVRALLRHGIVPAFGHSDADYEETRSALRSGMRYATHLFNAMRGIHHREAGAAMALLEDRRVSVELIADGFHVGLPVLRLAHTLKPPERIILVSDAAAPCGLKPGRYSFVGRTVELRRGRVTLPDGRLAGSALTLDRAVALEVRKMGLTPAQATLLATRNPARRIGMGGRRGEISPSKRADLVLLDRALRVRATWLGGALAWPTNL
jgi:N-acetylglucosamine-6-phosphate deacetylase